MINSIIKYPVRPLGNLLFLLLGVSLFIACSAPSSRNDPHEVKGLSLSHYGDSIEMSGAVPVSALEQRMEAVDSLPIKLSGEVTATCPKKGCWMKMALDGNTELRVTFRDYGFFVPTEGVEGKTAIIEGYASKSLTDVVTLKHYATDAGQSQEEIQGITAPREEIVFIASGVIIQD